MHEGEKVILVHFATGECYQCIIAGMDKEKGITLVNEEDPDEIYYCALPDDKDFDSDFDSLERLMSLPEEQRVYDVIKEAMKKQGLSDEDILRARRCLMFESLWGGGSGSSQEALHARCPFKGRK